MSTPEARIQALRRQCDRRLSALKSERSSWDPHWIEIAKYTLPRRGRFFVTPNQNDKGKKMNQAVLDSTGAWSALVLASGMMAGITSPARPWFRLTLSDRALAEISAVKLWLDEVTKTIQSIIAKSNIYQVLPELYLELGLFGTGAMLLLEDFDDVVRAYPLTVGEYYLGASKRGEIDTVYRVFPMTVGQMCAEFGIDNVTEQVRALYNTGKYDTERNVVHVIEPNHLRVPESPWSSDMPFRAVWYEEGSEITKVLKIAGHHDFPGMAPRWRTTGSDVYGHGPGMDALPDIRSLQVHDKREAQAIDKGVNPPMRAPARLKNEPMSVLPGGVTFDDGTTGGRFEPAYEVHPQWVQYMVARGTRKQEAVKRAFFVDLFLMISQMEGVQPRNNLEIAERKEEKMLMLGPVLESVHNTLLDPIITRIFNIGMRQSQGEKGVFPPPPPELANMDLEIEYISMLAQAQKSVATAGIERLAGFVGNLSAVKPEVTDKVDFDQSIDEYADMLGVPAKTIVPDDQVKQIRAQRQRLQMMQAGQAMGQQAVDTAKTGAEAAQVLSETQTGAGVDALSLMTGMGR